MLRGFSTSAGDLFSHTVERDPLSGERDPYKVPFKEIVVLRLEDDWDDARVPLGLRALQQHFRDGQGMRELDLVTAVWRIVDGGRGPALAEMIAETSAADHMSHAETASSAFNFDGSFDDESTAGDVGQQLGINRHAGL